MRALISLAIRGGASCGEIIAFFFCPDHLPAFLSGKLSINYASLGVD